MKRKHHHRSRAEAAGHAAKDEGMTRAALSKAQRIESHRRALLDTLLASPDRTATIDDATPDDELGAEYADGGKWRGTVTRSLASDGYIERVGFADSRRASRHAGPVGVWRLIDAAAARRYLAMHRAAG